MHITPEMLFEACYPLGDAYHDRAKKKRAVRLVVLEQLSFNAAARKVRVSTDAVIRWVSEFEMRLDLAKNYAGDGERQDVDAEAQTTAA
jgi:transposase